ncbi:cytochrome P450 [Streptomyces sp. YIM 98790]|uniref:cytochrome P450 n=1 Tax=Streptomyces sp. YIM 98790 TaxID=2689077 RepID=UPI001407CA0C|nr:cytochrome P450 [Streptomyces sp. YIM 98790]
MRQISGGRLGPLPEFLDHDDGRDVVPVVTPAGDPMWLVCDYALGRRVLTDQRFSRAEAAAPHAPQIIDAQPVPDSIASLDGAEHSRLRRIVAGAFSTGKVAAMAPDIERLAGRHLDAMAAAGPGADLIEGLAAPLPLAVLCSLLGVPEEDSGTFRTWVEVLFDISASSPREKARRRLELAHYMADLIELKRRSPQDDLLTAMVGAHDRGELTMSELLALGLALLMAGYETTVAQIGLSVLFLLSEADGWPGLVRRPDRLPAVAEELLRLTPSTPVSFSRVALETVPLGSVTVRAGEAVLVSLLHGNRDGGAFPDPARLAPDGHDAMHLTFGHGLHRCVGAPLARLQLRLVLEHLIRRFPALRLAAGPDSVAWKDGMGTRGLSRLQVAW